MVYDKLEQELWFEMIWHNLLCGWTVYVQVLAPPPALHLNQPLLVAVVEHISNHSDEGKAAAKYGKSKWNFDLFIYLRTM